MPRTTQPTVFYGLSWFDKQTEELVGEVPLKITPRELRRLLHLPARSPVMDSYLITRRHLAEIKTMVSLPLNLAQFDYFIEASTSPVPHHEDAV